MADSDSRADRSSAFSWKGRVVSSEEIVEVVLLSINAHYQRNADKVECMIDELKKLDQQELVDVFRGLRNGTTIEEAVPMLTEWIETKIDGTVL